MRRAKRALVRSLHRGYALLQETVREFVREDPFTQAGALSYYTLLSFAPFLLLMVAIVGLVYGEEAARGEIVGRLAGLVGAEAATVAQDVLAQAHRGGGGGLSAIVGGVFLFVGATTAFAQLRSALNAMWGVQPTQKTLWALVRTRLRGLLVIMALGAAVVAQLIAGSVIAALAALPGADALGGIWRLADLGVGLAVMTALLAILFHTLPDATIRWRDVWVGAAVTALLFTVGRWAIALYLGRASVGSAYGAAGSAIVLMAWIYYSSVIVLFGAELTQIYARRLGADVVPGPGAVPVGPEGHCPPDRPGAAPLPGGAATR